MRRWQIISITATIMLIISLALNIALWRHQPPQQEVTETASPAVSPSLTSEITSSGGNAPAKQETLEKLAAAEQERDELLEQYGELRTEVNLRLGIGKERQQFITPDNPAVAAKVMELTGGFSADPDEYWHDCEFIYRWLSKEIEYHPDSPLPMLPQSPNEEIYWIQDYWRLPEETLTEGIGDCEDMTLLLASMLINYNEGRYAVWIINIQNDEKGHVAIAIPIENQMLTILDPSIYYVTSPNDSALSYKTIDAALNHWLERWQEEIPDAEICGIFNDSFYMEFENTFDFLTWAYSR